jgi:glycosyltransferase involved in cell wall biosynthesis
MRILIVSEVMPIPPNAGNRARILGLIRELVSLGHEVHFALVGRNKVPDGDILALQSLLGGGSLHGVTSRPLREFTPAFIRYGARARAKILRVLGSEGSYYVTVDRRYDPLVTEQLKSLQKVHQFDTVVVEYVFMSRAFEAFPPGTLRVLDTHDSFGDRHRVFLRAGRPPTWFTTSPRREEAAFRRADVVIAIQEDEAEEFRRRIGRKGPPVLTVSHMVDLSRRSQLPDVTAAAFLGSVNSPNLAALDFLLQEILPEIVERQPSFKILVGGPISDKVARTQNVEPCGIVRHVSDLFARAPLSLNPITLGTGINIKLLDAMACGVPTVTTATGARGLAPRFQRSVRVVADRNPTAFALAVIELLENRKLRRQMADLAFADATIWQEEQRRALREVLSCVRAVA